VTESGDIEAIKRLKARYFRLMDTKDGEGLAEVFADDVEIDMTGEGGRITRGVGEYVPFLRTMLEHATTVHHGHMPEVELTSPTTATGVWAMEDRIWWPEGSPLSHLHGYGHYTETYEKTGGRWLIKTMVLIRLHRQLDVPT
jgi:uncharacterized protein (TIGR02246 family)